MEPIYRNTNLARFVYRSTDNMSGVDLVLSLRSSDGLGPFSLRDPWF